LAAWGVEETHRICISLHGTTPRGAGWARSQLVCAPACSGARVLAALWRSVRIDACGWRRVRVSAIRGSRALFSARRRTSRVVLVKARALQAAATVGRAGKQKAHTTTGGALLAQSLPPTAQRRRGDAGAHSTMAATRSSSSSGRAEAGPPAAAPAAGPAPAPGPRPLRRAGRCESTGASASSAHRAALLESPADMARAEPCGMRVSKPRHRFLRGSPEDPGRGW